MAKKNSSNNKSTWELNQQSIDYLGVSKQPFANEILTEESFFKYQALDKISDSLVHQIQFSELLLIIEGLHGAGKTAFFRQLIQLEIANTKTLAIQAEATDTLTQIQQKMSIHMQDLGDASHLDDNLKSLQMFDQTPLAVINNSHVLSDTTLQELLRYQHELKQEQDVTLKILLFANTGISDTLQKISDIQADQIYVQRLPEFSPKQASAFITHRLRCAGYYGEAILDDDAITLLFKTCNGTPLDIMTQAVPLIDKAVSNILKPAPAVWQKILVASIILSILAGSGYGAFIYLNNTTDETPVTQPYAETDQPIMSIDIDNNHTEENEPTDVINILENDNILTEEHRDIKQDNLHDSIEQATQMSDEVTTENTTPEKTAPEQTTSETMISESPAKESATIKSTSEKLDEPAPETQYTPEENPAKTTAISLNTPTASAPELSPILLQLKEMGLQDASWLLQQPAQNWTLQLLGAREPKTLLTFARNNQLSSNAAWYKTWLTSKPYYVMVYGSYTSKDAARESIGSLPAGLRSLKPWIKSMQSVQKPLQ